MSNEANETYRLQKCVRTWGFIIIWFVACVASVIQYGPQLARYVISLVGG
jgi:hypothetical protein